MYNIEQIRLLITYKEKQLRELKNDSSTSPIEIKKVEDELQSLEIYSVRYEIAKIIGYENNDGFKNSNYAGIELEDFTKMNLSQEQLDNLSNLVSRIPAHNADLYRTRLEMAKLLKLDEDKSLQAVNYEGIENNNPSSMQFRLSVRDVARFNSLRNRVTILRQSNNFKNSNFNTLANELREELINKLNNMDLDDYEANKEEELETLYKLLDSMEGEKQFPEISNYAFAYDLSKKYPEINLKLSNVELLKVIDLLDHDQDIEQEKYNDYLKIVISNVNELLKEENVSSDEAKAVIDRINKSNYTLRIDITNNIKDENISFKDKDIEELAEYLDKNYDSLEEPKRDKLTKFLIARLATDIKIVDNAERINKIIEGIKNKELREKIRTALSKNKEAIFSDRHVNSYSGLIGDKIKKLEAKKKKYQSRKTGIAAIDVYNQTRIKEIDKEIERLKQLNLNYDDNVVLDQLDNYYNSKSSKIIKIEKEIAELKKLKADLKTEFQRKSVDRQIKHLQDRIKKLQRAQVRIEKAQKRIMTPKMFINLKRGMVERHFESKSEVYSDYADDYRKRAETTRAMGGMFSGIKAAFYEFKAGRYRTKSELNRAIFDIISKPGNKVTVAGSNQKVVPKKSVQALQQMNQQQVAQVQMAA